MFAARQVAFRVARNARSFNFGDITKRLKDLEYLYALVKRYPKSMTTIAAVTLLGTGVLIGKNLQVSEDSIWQMHLEKFLIERGLLVQHEKQEVKNAEEITKAPFFIDREVANEVKKLFERPSGVDDWREFPVTIVQGPQGSGKSEIINPLIDEYVHKHRVFAARRIVATTKEELLLGLMELAVDLNLNLIKADNETDNNFEDRLIDAVASTLKERSKTKGSWVLYFDLKDKDLHWLTKILYTHRLETDRDHRLSFNKRNWGEGRVIIATTNTHAEAHHYPILDEPQDIKIVKLDGLTIDESKELFRKLKVDIKEIDWSDFVALYARLGGAPLALNSAALYIREKRREKGMGYGPHNYLRELNNSFKDSATGFDVREIELRRDLTYKETQKQVIKFGFNHTEQTAQDFLLILARLNQKVLPKKWLEAYAQIKGISEGQLLHEVCRYGIAIPIEDGVMVHDLVLEELKQNFEALKEADKARLRLNHFQLFIRNLKEVIYPATEAKKREQDTLVEQTFSLFNLEALLRLDNKDLVAEALLRLLQYHVRARNFKVIQDINLISLLENMPVARLTPNRQAERLLILANYYLMRNQFTKANDYCNQAQAILTIHPDLGLLAERHRIQGRAFGSSLELDKALEQLEVAKRLFIETHDQPGLRDCLYNIAAIKKARNNVKEGIADYEKALRLTIKLFGEEHQEAARIYNDLGLMEHLNGNDALANYYLQRAATLSKRNVGEHHTDTSQFMRDAASILLLTDPVGAEAQVAYAINIQEKNKENQAMIARSKMVLGDALLQQGKTDEARAIYQEVRVTRLREYPYPKHPEHANVLLALAKVDQHNPSRITEVIANLEKAKEIYEADPKALKLFERSKSYLELIKLLADKYLETNQQEKALIYYNRLFALVDIPICAPMREIALKKIQAAGINSHSFPKAILSFYAEKALRAGAEFGREPDSFIGELR